MNEHKFSAKLGSDLRARGRYVWKINANFAGGVPDMWVAGQGGDIWIENKWIRGLPKRESTRVKPALSSQQLEWLIARDLQNVQVSVVLAAPEGCIIFNTPDEWREGITATEAARRIMSRREVVDKICARTGASDEDTHESPTAHRANPSPGSNRRAAKKPLAARTPATGVDPPEGTFFVRFRQNKSQCVYNPGGHAQHKKWRGYVAWVNRVYFIHHFQRQLIRAACLGGSTGTTGSRQAHAATRAVRRRNLRIRNGLSARKVSDYRAM